MYGNQEKNIFGKRIEICLYQLQFLRYCFLALLYFTAFTNTKYVYVYVYVIYVIYVIYIYIYIYFYCKCQGI